MNQIRVLVGTHKGAFILTSDEKRKKWEAAKLYYNEASNLDPNSAYGVQAREKIDALNKRIQGSAGAVPQPPAATQ